METYTFLREMADSWALLLLFVFFVGTWVWAFRPGSRAVHRESADIPFRHEDAPAPAAGCGKGCPDCTCTTFNIEELQR